MTNDASTLIIPVESQVRELDAKLLLAAVAAERGFPVVIGSRTYVRFALPRFLRGVFLAKSMRFTSDRMTGIIRGFGHHIVAVDEESLVRFSHPDYYAWRFSAHSFAPLKHLFAWGRDDAEMFRGYSGRGDVAIHATGNPRMDLLRDDLRGLFESEAAALREAHGSFVLINTNFSFVNNFVPALNLIRYDGDHGAQVGRTGRGMSLEFALGMSRHQQAICHAFETLIPALARAFPERTIVLRPHPSENHERWRALTAEYANVRVLHEGGVAPWLMAAAVLVHNGCTTAVEAAMVDTPAVTYRPVAADRYDYHLPNSLSLQTHDVEATVDAVAQILAGYSRGVAHAERERILARHVEQHPTRLAADRIVDVLVDNGYLKARPPDPGWKQRTYAAARSRIRTLKKQINMRRPHHRNNVAYLRHRFPALDAGAVNARLAALSRALGRFHGLYARPAGTDMFTIAPSRRVGDGWRDAASETGRPEHASDTTVS